MSSSVLKSLEIVEMSGEEYLGAKYIPFTPSTVLPKQSKHRTFLKRKKVDTTKYPVVPVRPFEERWSQVVDYHRSHTFVGKKELDLRYNLLLQWRDSQRNITLNEDTQYIVYWPPQAGIGNTISFLGCALLLSLYTNRKFLSALSTPLRHSVRLGDVHSIPLASSRGLHHILLR